VAVAATTAACRQDMHDSPRYDPLQKSEFFADKRTSRPLIPGTIARGTLKEDKLLYAGLDGEAMSQRYPFPVTAGVLARGRERYNIYCSPCHSTVGDGRGMIVERGYKQPASFHEPRLRESGPGYFFTAMTNGFGVMPSYSFQVPAEDRWAIAAYIKALQLSRNVRAEDLTAEERQRLAAGEGEAGAAAQGKESHGG